METRRHPKPTRIVIVGGGIIGVSTAYYLTQHPLYDRATTEITVIESTAVAAGASGKAGGLLALDWHSNATAALARLSYTEHEGLARKYGGAERWGFRRLDTISVQTNSQRQDRGARSRRKSRGGGLGQQDASDGSVVEAAKEGEIDWLDASVVEKTSVLGTRDTTAQVHPRKFCHALLSIAQDFGVVLKLGHVIDVGEDNMTDDSAHDNDSGKSDDVGDDIKGRVVYIDKQTGRTETIPSDCTIVAAGPWTKTLLPSAPVTSTRAHSITIIPSAEHNGGRVTPHAVFSDMTLRSGARVTPEFYAREDEVYVCGDGDDDAPVPKTADAVQVVTEKCEELWAHAGELSGVLRRGRLGVMQACYLPVAETSLGAPLVGRVPRRKKGQGTIIVAAAHSCWGICLGPGTGKVVSELVFDGKVSSADIRMLDPAKYMP